MTVRRVSSPIAPGDRGDRVAALHTALRALVTRGGYRVEPAPNRPTREELDTLVAELGSEREDGQSEFREATRTLVLLFQVQHGLGDHRLGIVDDPTAATINRELERLGALEAFLVAGTVRDASGVPAAGFAVQVLDRDLRSSELLGEAQTDAAGRYEVVYGAERFAAGEVASADVQVVVLRDGSELARSEVRFNAAPAETIDITLADGVLGVSEYERYLAQLEPALAGVPVGELREDAEHQDLSFLSGETGIPFDRLELLTQAAREATVAPSELPAEAFYAWWRYELPRERATLLGLPPSVLVRTLRRAIEEHVVPAGLRAAIKRIQAYLEAQRAADLLRPAEGGAPPSLGDALALARDGETIDPAVARRLALLVAERTPDEDTLARAGEVLGLEAQQLTAVRRGLALLRVSDDAAVMRAADAARPQLADGCDQLPFAGIAALTEDEWATAIATGAPGAGETEVRRRARDGRRPHGGAVPARRPAGARGAAAVRRGPDNARRARREREPRCERVARRGRGCLPGPAARRSAPTGPMTRRPRRRNSTGASRVIGAVYAANSDVPVLQLDYMPDGDAETLLDLGAVEDSDRPLVVETFKAMRRVHEVTGMASHTQRLLMAGYGAATHLAAADPADRRRGDRAGPGDGDGVRRPGGAEGDGASLYLFTAYDAAHHHGRDPKSPVVTASVPVGDYFTRIPGYAELFGSTAFCDCRHCRSVLSPAAYFVDLMWFVQRTLTSKAFAGNAAHPLRLRARRPDLWTLPLTCANTDGLVPYLDIVNEILEAHVGKALATPALTRQQVYRRLARTTGSVGQPFHLQLERVVAYLGHFGHTRADAARALATDATTYTRAWLGASVTVWDRLIRSRATDSAFLTLEFGPAVVQAATAPADIDVQAVLGATSWSRTAFGELLATGFVRGSDQPSIRPDKRDGASVQNDVELVGGLTPGVLDRLARLWRLHVATGVPVPALDLLVRAIPAPPAGTDESGRLSAVVGILEAARRLGVPLDAAAAFVGAIPSEPLEPGGAPLFDRLFNLEPFVSQQGAWPQQMPASFVHPSLATTGTSTPDNRTLQRLLAGLQISDADLVELLTQLGLASPAVPAVALTRDILALLFRHALFARALNVPVADLGRVLGLAGVGRDE